MRRLLFILMAVVSSLIVVSCKDKGPDTAAHVANAYLIFSYGDSTEERVCVPMVESRGTWYLR